MKKTKIICSIGPSSNNPIVMEQMVKNGMDVGRINFSHATIEERKQAIDAIREVRKRTNKNVAILWDTKGPEFRCGQMENNTVLTTGKIVRIVKKDVVGNAEAFSVNHPEALESISVDDLILLENAKMKLKVISKETDGITCSIIEGGILGSRKSISVPKVKLNIPYISEADYEDIKYACENGGEFLAISFVSSKEDVLEVKELLHKFKREDLQIICKIENQLGIDNLEEILEVSSGIMVARGDLGSEVASERLPILQKQMIKTCRKMGKICIVATEMLETMMENNRPKRAETSDIANAVLDGTDAVMLSGETTVGKHPVETVLAMARICEVTEEYDNFDVQEGNLTNSINSAIAVSVVESAKLLDAKCICAATIGGHTARKISNLRPSMPILALCSSPKVERKLALNYGIITTTLPILNSTDEILTTSLEKAKEIMNLKAHDKVVITGGFPAKAQTHTTNLMKIDEI